jgi:hypothetical protein
MNHWTDPEVAGHFKPYTAKKRTVTFTRTCPVMKNRKNKGALSKKKEGIPNRNSSNQERNFADSERPIPKHPSILDDPTPSPKSSPEQIVFRQNVRISHYSFSLSRYSLMAPS